MQVSVENTGELTRKLTVQIPSDHVEGQVEDRLKSLSTRVKVDGFRPGKVPMSVVKQRYGQGVFEEVAGEVMNRSFQEAVMQEKLRVAGTPAFEAPSLISGKDIELIASFEVYPDFEPASVDGVAIKRPVAEVQDENIDKMLDNLRQQRKTFESVDRASQEGDQVTIDFVGSVDGVEFDGGKGEDMPVTLGEGRMIKDFEQALYGKSAGDEFTVDVTFPEDYHAENLKGKAAQFAMTVKSVEEAKLPEVDDEFAKGFGSDSVEAMRSEVRANMQRELKQGINNRVKDQVMDALVEINTVSLPEALVSDEIERMRQEMLQQMGGQSSVDLPGDLFKDQAERRVKLGLVIGEMIRAHDIKLSKDKMDEILDDLVAGYEDAEAVKQHYRSNQQAMANIEGMTLEAQIVEFVLEKAKVTDEAMDFDAIMNPQAQS